MRQGTAIDRTAIDRTAIDRTAIDRTAIDRTAIDGTATKADERPDPAPFTAPDESRREAVSEPIPGAGRRLPVVVDLDPLCRSLAGRWRLAASVPGFDPKGLARGLVAAAAAPEALDRTDADTIPGQEASRTLALAREAHGEGHAVILLTAAHPALAERLYRGHPWVTDLIVAPGTDAIADLARLAAVQARCPGGFSVLPGTRPVPRWARNASVHTPDGAQAAHPARPVGRLTFVARVLRLHQWVKNLLIFLPLVLAGNALDPRAWTQAAIGFLAFGLIASATYLVNDLHDLPHDRGHRSKRHRPLASGALSVPAAIGLAAIGLAAGLLLMAGAGAGPLAIALGYLAGTLAYTFLIKRYPLVDAVALGGLFTLRLIAGITVCAVAYSSWLLVLSMLLFTSLALVKRLIEIQQLGGDPQRGIPGRGYRADDAPVVLAFGAATGTAAVLIFSLYIVEAAARQPLYANPAFLWAAPLALFLWLGRVWLLCGRRALSDDPIQFAIRDWPSLALGFVVVASVILAF